MNLLIKYKIKINLKNIIYYMKNKIFYINLIINLFVIFVRETELKEKMQKKANMCS